MTKAYEVRKIDNDGVYQKVIASGIYKDKFVLNLKELRKKNDDNNCYQYEIQLYDLESDFIPSKNYGTSK